MNDIDERDERLGELLDRSVRSLEPRSDAGRAVRRGERRRVYRWVASVCYVAAFVLAVTWAGIVIRSNGRSPASSNPSATWVTYRDDTHGVDVSYPADWFRAQESLTPNLAQPLEILSLASYPLERTGQRLAFDGFVPGAAADVGPDGVFITLQEDPSTPRGFHDRPVSFDPAKTGTCPAGDCLGIPLAGPQCPEGFACPDTPGYHAWWIPFRDQVRGFYAFVAMGDDAFKDQARYDLAWQVLDSLRFDPRSDMGGVFAECPSLDGALPVGPDAAQTAEAAALDFVNASLSGDDATVARLSDPAAAANDVGVGFGTTATHPILGSSSAGDDPVVVGGCGQDVADHTWSVDVDDGTSSASLDVNLYLIERSDGWKVWGTY